MAVPAITPLIGVPAILASSARILLTASAWMPLLMNSRPSMKMPRPPITGTRMSLKMSACITPPSGSARMTAPSYCRERCNRAFVTVTRHRLACSADADIRRSHGCATLRSTLSRRASRVLSRCRRLCLRSIRLQMERERRSLRTIRQRSAAASAMTGGRIIDDVAISPHRRPATITDTDIEAATPILRRYSQWIVRTHCADWRKERSSGLPEASITGSILDERSARIGQSSRMVLRR